MFYVYVAFVQRLLVLRLCVFVCVSLYILCVDRDVFYLQVLSLGDPIPCVACCWVRREVGGACIWGERSVGCTGQATRPVSRDIFCVYVAIYFICGCCHWRTRPQAFHDISTRGK